MNAFVVNKKSWHYKIVSLFETFDSPKDFCSYWRAFMYGVAIIAAMILVVVTIIISAIQQPMVAVGLIFLMVFSIVIVGLWILLDKMFRKTFIWKVVGKGIWWILSAISFSIIWVLLILFSPFIGLYHLYGKLTPKKSKVKAVKSDGIFVTRYKSWKSKYCPMIEYK